MRVEHLVNYEEYLLQVRVDDVDCVVHSYREHFAVVSEIYTCDCLVVLPVVVLELDLPTQVQIKSAKCFLDKTVCLVELQLVARYV